MYAAIDYVLRSFELDFVGWTIMFVLAAPMLYMMFVGIENWMFRIVAVPSLILGAALVNTAMTDLALHFTNDRVVNQGVGFGFGMFGAMLLLSCGSWLLYAIHNE